jgi:L-serine dehydratase
MGLFGGFLGWEAYDERLVDSEMHIGAAGIQIKINIKDIQAEHPNTYQIAKNPFSVRLSPSSKILP